MGPTIVIKDYRHPMMKRHILNIDIQISKSQEV